ncbi:hypothetical protein CMUS01_02915 [Colletotrichum musicola]|uniref:Uncharacterized protein n=1 Tax=Colletotrichum musicola TaxID=2175873 RepID=A0A8H6NU54_9PEZI|nr:hypothetical protein CMUS01_02915 [Colletotrichum musicola]
MGSFQMSDAYIWYYNENGRERRSGLPALEIGNNRALLIPVEVYCRFSKDGGNTLYPEPTVFGCIVSIRLSAFDISRMKQNAGLKPEDACDGCRW